MADEIKRLPVKEIFNKAFRYFQANQKTLRFFWLANLILLGIFSLIPKGFSNPYSMLWLLVYYVYWCGFFRLYYQKKPYFFTKEIFGSMVPSTKIFFITLFAAFLLVILPYLPLLMGFNDSYLIFFERYMEALQNVEGSLLNRMAFTIVLILISPLIICRPFFAWISALQGYNGSMRKAFRKTEGNYWNFVTVMFLLNLPCALIYELDLYLSCHGWLSGVFYSLFFLYLNLVFAKMYDFFYND